MPLVNPLSDLKDIHLPSTISFWPPAPGWWLILVLVFIVILLLNIWTRRIYRRIKPKKEALYILNNIKNNFYKKKDNIETVRKISILIRRVSLTIYKQKYVANLHGIEWLKFLDESGNTEEFTNGDGKVFGQEIYKKNPNVDINSLFIIVEKWINNISQKYQKNSK